jgi:potassium-transporting ATPase potassium-binding subunit
MSYFSQMAALAWQNFVSAAARSGSGPGVGPGADPPSISGQGRNRDHRELSGLICSGPLFTCSCRSAWRRALVAGLPGGSPDLSPYLEITTWRGENRLSPWGRWPPRRSLNCSASTAGASLTPTAPILSRTPPRSPISWKWLLIFAIPAALTYTYGRMARDQRQGWVIFGAMALAVSGGGAVTTGPKPGAIRRWPDCPSTSSLGNLEGKEIRFGVAASPLCHHHHRRFLRRGQCHA